MGIEPMSPDRKSDVLTTLPTERVARREGIEPPTRGFGDRCSANELPTLEPKVRFELTSPFGSGLQNHGNRPLCDFGMEQGVRLELTPKAWKAPMQPSTPALH